MTTHGDMWLSKAHGRIEGWCKTRGWRCGPPRCVSGHHWASSSQYEVFIGDRMGRVVSIAFDMQGDRPELVDEGGIAIGFDAVVFDEMMAPHDLATPAKPSRKQLELAL